MLRKYVLFFLFFFPCLYAQAQPAGRARAIDSLKAVLVDAPDDTNKVNLLVKIGTLQVNYDPKEALKYLLPATELAEKEQWKAGMAKAYNSAGACYKGLADYPTALNYYFKSLRINEEAGNKEYIGRTSGNIGNVYRELKNFPKALEYLQKALAINTELGRTTGISDNNSDMGIVYAEMGDTKKALEYFDRALEISQKANDQEGVAIVYGNIGNIYSKTGKYEEAIENFTRSVDINKSIGREVGAAINTINIALARYELALDTGKYKRGISAAEKERQLNQAAEELNMAIPIFIKIEALDNLADAYKGLADVSLLRKDYKTAFDAYGKYDKLKDSISSTDRRLKLANLTTERAEYEKRQQAKLTVLAQNKRRNETILFGLVIILLTALVLYVVRARRRSEKLLLNILPAEVAGELKKKGSAAARQFDQITVIFTDFVNFTSVAEKMDPQALVDELDTCFKAFDRIMIRYNIEKIKTIGDAYMAVAGLPVADPLHAVNTVKAALEIAAFIDERKKQLGHLAFDIRIGLNSGSVVAGIVGLKKFVYDIWGDTVNTAARMEQNSEPGKINISQTTYELVKDHFVCSYRGALDVKNKGMLKMYFVER